MQNNICLIGESKIQETEQKVKQFTNLKLIKLHLIGHLQSNKTRKAIKLYDTIQTVDSIKLLDKINYYSTQVNKKQKIFLQVNTTYDKNKYGFAPEQIIDIAKYATKLTNVAVKGIMMIPTKGLPNIELHKAYSQTRKIKEEIQKTVAPSCKYLSMGMSNDYEIAIEEGATHIRIGTALFGRRKN